MSKYHFFILFFVCFISIRPTYSQVNLANGLVGHYPFNGNSNDVSGNNNNGILQNNIQLTNDRFGNINSAYFFDGIDDYISVADGAGSFSTPHFSLVVWFKTNSNNLQNLVGKRDFGPTNGQQYQFFINYTPFPGIGSNIISDANSCAVGITAETSYINSGENICQGRWYCAVITFDGLQHKIYINGILKQSVATGFNTMSRCNSELRFGNWWQGDLIPYSGIMDDIRWYNRPLSEDEIAVLSEGSNRIGNADFTYKNLVCKPAEVSFNTLSSSPVNVFWDFGDMQTLNSNLNPVHTYNSPGVYNVRLITESGPNCADTVIKAIDIRQLSANLIFNSDTSICAGDSVNIRTTNTGDLCWTVSNGSPPANTANIFVKPQVRTTYTLASLIAAPNLVVNGNFNNGNLGFSSDYNFTLSRTGDGQFGISTLATQWYPGLNCTDCSDHTNDTNGNMMIIDGSIMAGKQVWNSLVPVAANTDYNISFWANAYDNQDLAQLELYINDNRAGQWSATAAEAGAWKQFSINWNSGAATVLQLNIRNTNLSAMGNRFSLDDISVTRNQFSIDTFSVNVNQVVSILASDDTVICVGQSAILNAAGGTDYSWTPVSGLSDPSIPNPIANPLVSTWYKVNASLNSCFIPDSVLVTVNSLPIIVASNDTSICSGITAPLSVSGGLNYTWTPAVGLSDPSSANPGATPLITTRYVVEGRDAFGCSSEDSVIVSVIPSGIITASTDTITCFGTPVQLNANGSLNYKWTPATGLSDAGSADPIATPAVTTLYIVSDGGGSVCTVKDSVLVTVNPLPQLLTSDDVLTCNGLPVQISASGGVRYNWTPATGLSDPDIPNPFANPLVTTVYKVEAVGANNCIATDEVKVNVSAGNKIYVPNAFTPNGDGLNDCFGIKGADGATIFELAVYNRFGERIFFTKDPDQCWDGKYKSNIQPIGTYAWYLRMQSPCGNVDQKGTISIVK